MKIAVIDMGTNTFHLLIAKVKDGGYTSLHRERTAVKIGEKGINKGEINPAAWSRGITALKSFKDTIDHYKVNKIFATATSATRNASNGQAFIEEIKKETGIDVDVISGLKEAELIHLGASRALDFGSEKCLIMDIGGGSIEFIIADQHQSYWMQSFEIGGQRLVERFHKSDPIAHSEIEHLKTYFEEQLQPLFEACQQYDPKTLIGCSGTFDTLSDIYCEEEHIHRDTEATELPFSITAFENIYQQLIQKTRSERLKIPGMLEMRVEMIVVACVLVDYLIKRLELHDIRVSAYALKEGIIHYVIDQLQLNHSPLS